MASAVLPSVFLHSGWRTGSTYLWSKFRGAGNTLAYYEPFHEMLATLTQSKAESHGDADWTSRHPRLDRPYMAEYVPLLRPDGGIEGYEESFAVARYFPDTGTGDDVQIAYLRRLERQARETGQQAVFGFCRSLGRAGWLKDRLGGVHITLIRDAFSQWTSCSSFREGNGPGYFELCHPLILMLAPAGTPAARVARSLGLPAPRGNRIDQQLKYLRRHLSTRTDDVTLRSFLAVHILGHAAALHRSDIVIDIDLLGSSAPYRRAVAGMIGARTGIVVDFADCRSPIHPPEAADGGFYTAAAGMIGLLGDALPEELIAGAAGPLLLGKLGLMPVAANHPLSGLVCRPAPSPRFGRLGLGLARLIGTV